MIEVVAKCVQGDTLEYCENDAHALKDAPNARHRKRAAPSAVFTMRQYEVKDGGVQEEYLRGPACCTAEHPQQGIWWPCNRQEVSPSLMNFIWTLL